MTEPINPPVYMAASEVRQNFSATINRVAEEETRIIIRKDGAPVAAIVPLRDVRSLEQSDAKFAAARAAIERLRDKFKDVDPEELDREAEKAIREVRADMEAERKRLASTAGVAK